MSFMLYGIHYPHPAKEAILIEAMHTFGTLIKQRAGVLFVDIFRNSKDGTIVSLAIWESKQAFEASWPELVKRAPAQEWEVKPREAYVMDSV